MSVRQTDFYQWSDFISELGGTLKIVQVFINFTTSFFIFNMFYSFMAVRVYGESERKKDVMNIISSEGVVSIYDKVEECRNNLEEIQDEFSNLKMR